MSFQRFYETWLEQLRQLVHQLTQSPTPPITDEHHLQLRQLVQKTMSHHTEYHRTKSLFAKQDVLAVYTAPWSTYFERSLHWIGGWRPTTAFHLVYTEASILFESHVVDILRGFRTGDLGDLSPGQLSRVSELQCDTVKEENAITDELSHWQDGAIGFVNNANGNLEEPLERLAAVLEKADQLRLKTIENLVELLTPQQAAEFLVAAAQLQFGIHAWGVEHDRQRGNIV